MYRVSSSVLLEGVSYVFTGSFGYLGLAVK